MKTKALLIALSLSLIAAPVRADTTFDNLTAEKKSLIQTVVRGGADDSVVQRLQEVQSQIQSYTTQRAEQQQAQQSALIQNMDRVDNQMQSVNTILFGGGQASTNGSASSPTQSPVSSGLYVPPPTRQQSGHVSYTQSVALGEQIDRLVKVAVMKTPTDANRAVDKYNRPLQKFIAFNKTSFNYMIPYRGFGPASEAGDIILGEKLKLKSLSAALYAQQRFMDQTHLDVTTQVLQLAQSTGEGDITAQEAAYKALVDLTSKEEADRTKALLDGHLQDTSAPLANLDIVGRQAQYKDLLKKALSNDNVIKSLTDNLHKYNTHSKAMSISEHVVPALLGVASLTGNFVGPVARGMLCSYLMLTGGVMDKQLLEEIYLAERMQSRASVLADEIHMELAALDTNNNVLRWASESLLNQ